MSVHLIVEQAPAAALVRRVERAFAARARERFALALPGGSVATTVFPLLREAALDWARVDLLWGDERLVPLTHADSNYALAKPLLLDFVTPRGARVHPVDAAAPDAYEAVVRHVGLDFVLCGLGPDGHVCSLFPGHPALEETARWVSVLHDSPKPPPSRATLTLPALHAASAVVVMALGASKREVVGRCVRGDALPAVRALSRPDAVLLVDSAAA